MLAESWRPLAKGAVTGAQSGRFSRIVSAGRRGRRRALRRLPQMLPWLWEMQAALFRPSRTRRLLPDRIELTPPRGAVELNSLNALGDFWLLRQEWLPGPDSNQRPTG